LSKGPKPPSGKPKLLRLTLPSSIPADRRSQQPPVVAAGGPWPPPPPPPGEAGHGRGVPRFSPSAMSQSPRPPLRPSSRSSAASFCPPPRPPSRPPPPRSPL
uniref:Uncharacterized protein n=1 Tax=Aegilops tauschii subsp. strangulata TaxID=200361 RepID=A0A453RY74_AEGTS